MSVLRQQFSKVRAGVYPELLESFMDSYWDQVTWLTIMLAALATTLEVWQTPAGWLTIGVGLLTVEYYGRRHRRWLYFTARVGGILILIGAVSGWIFNAAVASSVVVMMSFPGSFVDDFVHGRWDRVFR